MYVDLYTIYRAIQNQRDYALVDAKVYPHLELWMTIVLPICATIVIDIFIFRSNS